MEADFKLLKAQFADDAVQKLAVAPRRRGPQELPGLDGSNSEEITVPVTSTGLDQHQMALLQKCGRWCFVFRACFVEVTDFHKINTPMGFAYNDSIRFALDNKDHGVASDLRDSVPERYWELMSTTDKRTAGGKCCQVVSLFDHLI